ncbi:MAG: NADH-ubiquinone oxidoreductase-F iron-sulfur binding region domain-containing protein [Dehalococcoidia bacterium]|nr:NADH-ubiquinone oxidoreductase-F iron-sulfur binding region domain-containing protein [Dehalococcoidia bacterium]
MSTYGELRRAADAAWAPLANPPRALIKVGVATCSRAVGAEETLAAVRAEVAARGLEADVMLTGCWGLCYAEPIVEIHPPQADRQAPVLYQRVTADKVPALLDQAFTGPGVSAEYTLAVVGEQGLAGVPPLAALDFFRIQVRRLMANCGVTDPENIDHYIARGGYEGLSKALTLGPERVIKELLDSGLWGRGGAAFPTGRKWDFLRGSARKPKYMICNADEGDPGSFVNRNLMESDPHLIVEGMIIGGLATEADYGYIYIRDEYPLPVARMRRAIEQAREKGLLGKDILGSGEAGPTGGGFAFDLEVVRGAGSYVCGEETGLIASLEDRRGMPKIRPPFPAQAGVFAQPSNVNNVESYANAPLVLRHGADWWSNVGSENHKGTKMFSLSGQVQRAGVLEAPLGTKMSDVVMVAGGGPPEGRRLKAVQPGGPLSGIIPASDVDIPLEPEPFRERGMFMGSGGLVVIDDSNCILDLCIYFEWFAEDESCGRCTTCFAGTRRMLEILRRISSGRGRAADLELIRLLGEIARNANCVHGQAAPTAVMSMFRFFDDELQEHLVRRRCPAKACRGLIRYEVARQSERLPLAEEICPTRAVVHENGSYRIDQEKCVRCDACREQAPYAIAVVDEFGP